MIFWIFKNKLRDFSNIVIQHSVKNHFTARNCGKDIRRDSHVRCSPVSYSLLLSFHRKPQKGREGMCCPCTSLLKFTQLQLRQFKIFKTCSLRKNLHLNCSLQFLESFPHGMFMTLFSLVLTKFNFITSALLHRVVSRRGTYFIKQKHSKWF